MAPLSANTRRMDRRCIVVHQCRAQDACNILLALPFYRRPWSSLVLPEIHNGRISTDALFVCHDFQTDSDLVLVENMEAVNPRRDRVIRVTVACGILATVAVCLRFVARWRSKASFAADDWWMGASLIPLHCMLAVSTISSFANPAFSFSCWRIQWSRAGEEAGIPTRWPRAKWQRFWRLAEEPLHLSLSKLLICS